jgi:hypothetical protein
VVLKVLKRPAGRIGKAFKLVRYAILYKFFWKKELLSFKIVTSYVVIKARILAI